MMNGDGSGSPWVNSEGSGSPWVNRDRAGSPWVNRDGAGFNTVYADKILQNKYETTFMTNHSWRMVKSKVLYEFDLVIGF